MALGSYITARHGAGAPWWAALSVGVVVFFAGEAAARSDLPMLRTVREVKQLALEEAMRRHPVQLRAVVTFVNVPNWQLFVQDETGGIFIEIHGDYDFGLAVGELLEIEGISAPGGFAPDVEPKRVTLLGRVPLPEPRQVTFDQMAEGQEDCNRVEFVGIVRSARPESVTWPGLNLVGGNGRVIVPIARPDFKACEELVDAEVSVRGICIAQFNSKEQLIQVAVQTGDMSGFSIIKPPPSDPYSVPLRKNGHLLQYALQREHGHRVKVRGVVTFQQTGRSLFLIDDTQGLYVQTRQSTEVQPGDIVEALGFPATGQYVAPILEDAVYRKIGSGPPPTALQINPANATRDTNHAALVQMEATLLDRAQRQREQILELSSGGLIFDARLETASTAHNSLAAIPDGSRVRLTGICLVPANLTLLPRPQAFTLLLRSDAGVQLLERPSWWTVPHTLRVLAATLAAFGASLVWTAMLRSQVKGQTKIIRQKAQREAALEERSRIARDLHDDLGSGLTQITMLSDRPQNGTPGELPSNLRKIGVTAREMAQSLDEIVWVVNPEHDSLEGLVEYLSQTADDFLEDTSIRLRLKSPASLPRRAVAADVRHQLFLAFKEGLNNAVKHAGASEIEIELAVTPSQFEVSIADNGAGFDLSCCRPGGQGLKNIRKRLETLGGQLELSSRPGQGTLVKMAVPL